MAWDFLFWKMGFCLNDGEVPGTVNEYVAQNWFRCFKKNDISLEDKPWPGIFFSGRWGFAWMMWKSQGLSTNMWHKTDSDVSRKMTLASKINHGQGFSFLEDGVLLEMSKQQPSICTCILSAKDGPSQSTINQHLHKFNLVNWHGNTWNTK